MTNDVKANGKKDKNFLDDILDSCQEFFAPIISAVESVFKSIYSEFESFFSNGSNKGSSVNSGPSVVSRLERNTGRIKKNARQSIAELIILKPLNEGQLQKTVEFEKELKNSAEILVNDYVIKNQGESDVFVANDDEKKFRKIKEYFIKIHDAQESGSNTEVSDLFDNYLKMKIIEYCKELLREGENSFENLTEFTDIEKGVINKFIVQEFSENEKDKILLFTVSSNFLKEVILREFVRDQYPEEQFDFKRLTKLVSIILLEQDQTIELEPPSLELGPGVSPGPYSTKEFSPEVSSFNNGRGRFA